MFAAGTMVTDETYFLTDKHSHNHCRETNVLLFVFAFMFYIEKSAMQTGVHKHGHQPSGLSMEFLHLQSFPSPRQTSDKRCVYIRTFPIQCKYLNPH